MNLREQYPFVVLCQECNEEHYTTDVTFVNIEEDFRGCDVMTFICPVTNIETKSRVYPAVTS